MTLPTLIVKWRLLDSDPKQLVCFKLVIYVVCRFKELAELEERDRIAVRPIVLQFDNFLRY